MERREGRKGGREGQGGFFFACKKYFITIYGNEIFQKRNSFHICFILEVQTNSTE